MAKANPFRFSTKYQDDESDLLYYGYRYYSTSMGRWICRDPIAIEGARQIYVFVGNAPLSKSDAFGLYEIEGWTDGFDVTVFGKHFHLGPNGGEIGPVEKTVYERDASVRLGGYNIHVKGDFNAKLLSLRREECHVTPFPPSFHAYLSLKLWPLPPVATYNMDFALGEAFKESASVAETISYPNSTVTAKWEHEDKQRIWGFKCGKCLESQFKAEASASADYNDALPVMALAGLLGALQAGALGALEELGTYVAQ